MFSNCKTNYYIFENKEEFFKKCGETEEVYVFPLGVKIIESFDPHFRDSYEVVSLFDAVIAINNANRADIETLQKEQTRLKVIFDNNC